jgi:periplasmic divalent cation tolerance protein
MYMIDKESDINGVILISTFPDENSLINLSKIVVMDKRICACINYTTVKSLYMWQSKLHEENEYFAFFKTTSDCVEKLKTEIRNNHPYDVPEIVVINMSDISPQYFEWMYKNTHAKGTNY